MKNSVYLKKNSANTFFLNIKRRELIYLFVHRLIVIFPRFCLYIDI